MSYDGVLFLILETEAIRNITVPGQEGNEDNSNSFLRIPFKIVRTSSIIFNLEMTWPSDLSSTVK